MKIVSTIFWDLDGTLVNTDSLYDEVILEVIQENKLKIKKMPQDIPIGLTLKDAYKEITGINNDELEHIEKLTIDRFIIRFNNKHVIQRSIELFNYFEKKGLKQILVSNSKLNICENITKKIGIFNYLSKIISIDNVSIGKPNEEIYLYALKSNNLFPSQCLAFEDSSNGIISSKLAKISTVAVGYKKNMADFFWEMNDSIDSLLLQLNKLISFAEHTNA